jgi:hypothetical protein
LIYQARFKLNDRTASFVCSVRQEELVDERLKWDVESEDVNVGTALVAVRIRVRTGTPQKRDFASLNKPCPYIKFLHKKTSATRPECLTHWNGEFSPTRSLVGLTTVFDLAISPAFCGTRWTYLFFSKRQN